MVASARWLVLGVLLGCAGRPPTEKPDFQCGSIFQDNAHVRLCLRIAERFEWTLGGRSTFSPGWYCTQKTVEAVVCAHPAEELAEVSGAYDAMRKLNPVNVELLGCLADIQGAMLAPSQPEGSLERRDAIDCAKLRQR